MSREIISPDIASGAVVRPSVECPDRNQLLESYLRREDVLCRKFLQQGQNPADFEAVRLFFPYVRELSACRAPREWSNVSDCQFFAYYGGHDLGHRHPELQGAILPGEEEREAKRRLQVLHQHAEGSRLNQRALGQAFSAVAEAYRPKDDIVNANEVVCALLLKSARAGYAAATAALTDPAVSDLLDEPGKAFARRFPATFERALVAAPWRTHEEGWMSLPPHPLLRLTREIYPEVSLEGKTVLGFLEERLQAQGVKSEEDCPTGELDLLDWVIAGLAFGRRLKREQPQLVAEIIQECEGERLEISRSVIRDVVAKAGKAEPLRLIRPLLEWYGGAHQRGVPGFYGQRLGRVGAIADFAVWIPWMNADEPKKRKAKNGKRRKA
ncbi:MAG: hypothetical protein WCH99_02335 [Verrucomicrobiota bacterium]